MANRLPIVGGDDGYWGAILNDFLNVSHNPDGTLIPSAVSAAGAITSINGKTGSSVTLGPGDVGADPSGAATTAQANAKAASVPNPGTTTFPTTIDTVGSSAAIAALEAKVGVNGSAVPTSLDWLVA